jgi:diguanylate cyclase (GGDEF)-like protein
MESKKGAFSDPLTQVYTKIYFEEVLWREVERANRYQHEFALLFIDIDQLKIFNDRGGRELGDQCLQTLATAAVSSVRSGDLVARYGEDEFVVFLAHCRPLDAIQCAHRIIEQLEKTPEHYRFTASIGLMHYAGSGKVARPEQLMSRAVSAVSHAKRKGGNRLSVAA